MQYLLPEMGEKKGSAAQKFEKGEDDGDHRQHRHDELGEVGGVLRPRRVERAQDQTVDRPDEAHHQAEGGEEFQCGGDMALELVRRLHLPGRVAGTGAVFDQAEQKADRNPGGEGGREIAQDVHAVHLFLTVFLTIPESMALCKRGKAAEEIHESIVRSGGVC